MDMLEIQAITQRKKTTVNLRLQVARLQKELEETEMANEIIDDIPLMIQTAAKDGLNECDIMEFSPSEEWRNKSLVLKLVKEYLASQNISTDLKGHEKDAKQTLTAKW
jgi:hypothetical protein